MVKKGAARTILLVLLLSTCALAEQNNPGPHELSVWVNRSFSNGHVFGFAQDRELFLGELRYGYRFASLHGVVLRYQSSIVPVAMLHDIVEANNRRQWTYGAGLSPVGLTIQFRPTRRVNPFLANTGGFLYFTERVLSPQAAQFNFTVELGGGVEVRVAQQKALVIGYKYHHFSNANTATRNPALDSHMIFTGIAWFAR